MLALPFKIYYWRNMKLSEFKLNAKWTDDCQGKKDYDGDIISISTRYWPSRAYIPNGELTKPSAKSSVILRFGENDYKDLISEEFEADTEEEVKRMVEKWAQNQMDTLIEHLLKIYK